MSRLRGSAQYRGAVSGLLSPVGPEPSVVYWVRRAALLLAVLTLLAGVWWFFGLRGSSGGGAQVEPAPSGPSSSAVAPSPQQSTPAPSESSAEPAPSDEPTDEASADVTDCRDSAIQVDATTDASTYAIGSAPRLTLTITNSGDVACKRDVGPKANELEITSGGFHVWSSDDCNPNDKTKVVTLDPGGKVGSGITWNGRLSAAGCPSEGSVAKPGRYELVGRNGDVTSDKTPFALTKGN